MAKKERKARIGNGEGLNNEERRCQADWLDAMHEFGDGRDLDGVAEFRGPYPVIDLKLVVAETPESILLAKEEAEQEEYEESETEEESEKIDVGTCVRVDGLLLCDYLQIKAREDAEQEMIEGFCTTFANKLAAEELEASRRMVVNKLAAFERDGVTKVGMRLDAIMHNADHFKDYERPPGHSPFKERRRIARSRRNQLARERIIRASERKFEEMWFINAEYYMEALAREWEEAEAERYEAEYERDLYSDDDEEWQEELLAFALEGKDERELEFYDRLDQEWDEAAYEELEAAYVEWSQEDMLNEIQKAEALAEEEERAEREELEVLERRWRGYFITGGAKSDGVPEDRVVAHNQAAIVRAVEEFERYGNRRNKKIGSPSKRRGSRIVGRPISWKRATDRDEQWWRLGGPKRFTGQDVPEAELVGHA